MLTRIIDVEAIRGPRDSGLPPCLYVPIAARDEKAIEQHVGQVRRNLFSGANRKALLVDAAPPSEVDTRLPIWSMPGSNIFHYPQQVWVHVDCSNYRQAYAAAFPDVSLNGMVLDHVLNRREARLKGYHYLRIVPVHRSVNSSAGSLMEKWGVDYHSSPQMRAVNAASKAVVQYADLADIVKMLNIMVGGGVMDVVNSAQAWVVPPKIQLLQ